MFIPDSRVIDLVEIFLIVFFTFIGVFTRNIWDIFSNILGKIFYHFLENWTFAILPERIYNPIKAMGFSAMFNFQLDNTKW